MVTPFFDSYIETLRSALLEVDRAALERVVDVLMDAREAGAQILLIGNGGSAATASHLACDLGKGTVNFADAAFRRFRALSLSDNNALMTALGNDLSFDDVFVEQLRTLMRPGDVVLAISASGNSPNLVRAVEYASAHGATTVGLLGFGGGKLANLVQHPLVVSNRNYGVAEDFHLIVQHVITQFLRKKLAGPARPVLFLDRDGVINERMPPHEYVRDWNSFRFVPGFLDTLASLSGSRFEVVVVTNQQGVAKGLMSAADLATLHETMRRAMADAGIVLAGVFACPHLDSAGCLCRKPRPGLIHRAVNEVPFLVDMDHSILVGDSEHDVLAGHAAGLRTVLIQNGPSSAPTMATQCSTSVAAALSLAATMAQQAS